jgi:hypothetical protein
MHGDELDIVRSKQVKNNVYTRVCSRSIGRTFIFLPDKKIPLVEPSKAKLMKRMLMPHRRLDHSSMKVETDALKSEMRLPVQSD